MISDLIGVLCFVCFCIYDDQVDRRYSIKKKLRRISNNKWSFTLLSVNVDGNYNFFVSINCKWSDLSLYNIRLLWCSVAPFKTKSILLYLPALTQFYYELPRFTAVDKHGFKMVSVSMVFAHRSSCFLQILLFQSYNRTVAILFLITLSFLLRSKE